MNLSSIRFRLGERTALRWEQRLFLEMMIVFLIIALLVGAILEQIPLIVGKARLTSLMAPASDGRLKVIEHYAVSGDWLDETESGTEYLLIKYSFQKPDQERAENLSARIGHIQQGAIHIEVHNRKRSNPLAPPEWWTIRPSVTGSDAPTVHWVCGSRSPPAGFRALGENLTSIPPGENFRFCQ
jgi:type II secretory pathway pseudopilin PulG